MYDVILLDLDHTILDFETSERSCLAAVFEAFNIDYKEAFLEQYKQWNKSLWQQLERGLLSKEELLDIRFTKYFEALGYSCDGNEAERIFRSQLDQSAELISGALEVLEALNKQGIRIFSASNGVLSTQMSRMKKAGILEYFEGHFISEEVQHEKPSLAFFEHCFKVIGSVPKRRILMVGDSMTSDIQGAINAGIDSCQFLQRDMKESVQAELLPTYVIRDLRELLEII